MRKRRQEEECISVAVVSTRGTRTEISSASLPSGWTMDAPSALATGAARGPAYRLVVRKGVRKGIVLLGRH